jgi:hypothetical protein
MKKRKLGKTAQAEISKKWCTQYAGASEKKQDNKEKLRRQ